MTRRHLADAGVDPAVAMAELAAWVDEVAPAPARPVFVGFNAPFDWMFVADYLHRFVGRNPFGHSSRDIGALYKGMVKDVRKNFKHLRKTRHTHNPVDDAMGNAEAMLAMRDRGLWIGMA